MFRNRRRSRIGRVAVAGAAALFAVGVAACSSTASSSSSSSTPPSSSPTASSTAAVQAGGDATVALPAGVSLNYIWPFVPITSANVYNTLGFQELLYRPLYYFGGNNSSIAVNYDLSTASAPAYSADGKTVTITMKGWKWSNGETVNANDVVLFLNILEAEKANYYGYVPGLLPDNLASYKATGPDTLVLNLKSAVSSVWFTYNQLAEITPFPEAWDVTSASAASGSGGCLTDSAKDKWAKCVAVYNFMSKQATNSGTYATSPIWAVVDGPWKLTSFSSGAGDDNFVPNPDYSGSPKPVLSEVTYKYFTDDSTEYTALKTGSLDVGYIPSQDLPQKPASQLLPTSNPLGTSYNLSPAYQDGIFYFQPNFNNPTVGPLFKQLYIRQALQEVIDQNGIDTAVYRGYGYPTAGPVPTEPKSQWVPSIEYNNNGQGPYAFSVSNATSLLTSHGWTNQGGTDVCTKPGTGAGECGAGIASGTKLNLTMDYPTGIEAYTQEVSVFKSDAQQAGINIDTIAETFTTIEGQDVACTPGPKCSWELDAAGGWLFNGPGFEPTGEPLFETGAGANIGSYSDPTEDNLINETHTSGSMTVFDQYATYTAQQLPFLWTPNAYAVQAVTSNLANVNFNPLDDFLPEFWNFTK